MWQMSFDTDAKGRPEDLDGHSAKLPAESVQNLLMSSAKPSAPAGLLLLASACLCHE